MVFGKLDSRGTMGMGRLGRWILVIDYMQVEFCTEKGLGTV